MSLEGLQNETENILGVKFSNYLSEIRFNDNRLHNSIALSDCIVGIYKISFVSVMCIMLSRFFWSIVSFLSTSIYKIQTLSMVQVIDDVGKPTEQTMFFDLQIIYL